MKEEKWEVYFSGNFWGHSKQDPLCEKIPFSGSGFVWRGDAWHVPGIYVCSAGLVLELCREVPRHQVETFMDRWDLWNGETDWTEEQLGQLEEENPLCLDIAPEIFVNGRGLLSSGSCSLSWNPCLPEGMAADVTAERIMSHYKKHHGFDESQGWVFYRLCCWWGQPEEDLKKIPELDSLTLRMKVQRKQKNPVPDLSVSVQQGDGPTAVFLAGRTGDPGAKAWKAQKQEPECQRHGCDFTQDFLVYISERRKSKENP